MLENFLDWYHDTFGYFPIYLWGIAIIYIFGIVISPIIKSRAKENKWQLENLRKANKAQIERQRNNPTKILYLRGFISDGIIVKSWSFKNVVSERFYIPDYEYYLSVLFGEIGHFVAVGVGPIGAELGFIGADRIYCSKGDWQGEVINQMDKASMIVFRPECSEGVLWEFSQIITRGYMQKMILCFLPKENNKKTYSLFKKSLGHLSQYLPEYSESYRFLYFDSKNQPHNANSVLDVPIYKAVAAASVTAAQSSIVTPNFEEIWVERYLRKGLTLENIMGKPSVRFEDFK